MSHLDCYWATDLQTLTFCLKSRSFPNETSPRSGPLAGSFQQPRTLAEALSLLRMEVVGSLSRLQRSCGRPGRGEGCPGRSGRKNELGGGLARFFLPLVVVKGLCRVYRDSRFHCWTYIFVSPRGLKQMEVIVLPNLIQACQVLKMTIWKVQMVQWR